VAVYATEIEAPQNLDQVLGELRDGKIDVVTFTSSSTVENFVRLVGESAAAGLSGKTLVASIGPVTAETAEKLGLKTDIMPADYTIEGLAEAIRDHFTVEKNR
jgi:uroporphyrinogen III methyltransferase/synthase